MSKLCQSGRQRTPGLNLWRLVTQNGVVRFTFPTHGIRPCSLPADEEDNPVIEALLPGRTLPALESDFLTEVKSHILKFCMRRESTEGKDKEPDGSIM